MKIEIGDVFHDIDHKWTDGSKTLDMIHVILSKDPIKIKDGEYTKESYWATANYMWASGGYCGASVKRSFSDEEVLLMKKVGNIKDIISFK